MIQSRAVVLVRALSHFVELHDAESLYTVLRTAVQPSKPEQTQITVDLYTARELLVLLVNCNIRLLKEP